MQAPELNAAADDDLEQLLRRTARTRGWPRGSRLLGAAVLLAAGVVGGVIVQQQLHPATATGSASSRFTAFGSRFAGSGAAGAAGSTGSRSPGLTVGTVRLVDGRTIYVQLASGGYVKVLTGPGTRIQVTKTGSVSSLSPGSTVVVTGTPGPGSTVAAQTITQGGAGGFGGLRFGSFGAAATGGGTGGGGSSGTTGAGATGSG